MAYGLNFLSKSSPFRPLWGLLLGCYFTMESNP